MTTLDSITVAQLEAKLDEQRPQWHLEWADQRDLDHSPAAQDSSST